VSPDAFERKARKDRKESVFSAGLAGFAFPVGLAVVFLALHLPYLPASLEDLDSINFALGVRDFDVAHHQPHPPGYPVFILIAKAVHVLVPDEAVALSLVSVAAGALGVIAIAALFRRLDGGATPRWTAAAVAVAMTTPLYWFTAVRPLSDMSGLAAAVAVQAMTLRTAGARGLAMAGFCAGLAAGIRSQVVWLTVPLLMLQGLGSRRWELAAGTKQRAPSTKLLVPVLAAFVTGAAVWFLPLVIISRGPSAYWHALMNQGAEDLGNIQMLWTMHRVIDVRDALYYAFVSPWAAWPLASAALACVILGCWRLARHQRYALFVLTIGFGPYLLFDLLFQETFTTRYALPLVVPLAYLAVTGLRLVPWDLGLAAAVAIAMFSAHLGGTSIAAYARVPAPAFRLLSAMQSTARSAPAAPVLALDRRQSFDLRRPIKWVGDAMPRMAEVLPSPAQHEWLEAVKYWNRGGRAPVWFVVDPMRANIDLVQHSEPERFRWPLPYPVLLSGARPNEMDWYRVERPEWYVGEGWALTPEAAGVTNADRRGPSTGAIEAWVERGVLGHLLMVGGRSLDATKTARLTVRFDGRTLADEPLPPGPFLRFVPLPADAIRATTYERITVEASAGSNVAIEQFDTSARRPLTGFGEGWHEPEFNPRTGMRWRWLSERGTLNVAPNFNGYGSDYVFSEPLTLHLEGESSRKYFSRDSLLTIRNGDRQLFAMPVGNDFSVDVPLLGSFSGPLVLETDQVFSPADRSSRSADRRHLGLRIFKAEIRKTNRLVS
jgi:hypothetical protein